MQIALKNAQISPTKIGYINAHGTSTLLGDKVEVMAIKQLFGKHAYKVPVSSTKSSIGHLLGAAGSVEAIFSILVLNNGIIPPTLNLHKPSDGCDLNLSLYCSYNLHAHISYKIKHEILLNIGN